MFSYPLPLLKYSVGTHFVPSLSQIEALNNRPGKYIFGGDICEVRMKDLKPRKARTFGAVLDGNWRKCLFLGIEPERSYRFGIIVFKFKLHEGGYFYMSTHVQDLFQYRMGHSNQAVLQACLQNKEVVLRTRPLTGLEISLVPGLTYPTESDQELFLNPYFMPEELEGTARQHRRAEIQKIIYHVAKFS